MIHLILVGVAYLHAANPIHLPPTIQRECRNQIEIISIFMNRKKRNKILKKTTTFPFMNKKKEHLKETMLSKNENEFHSFRFEFILQISTLLHKFSCYFSILLCKRKVVQLSDLTLVHILFHFLIICITYLLTSFANQWQDGMSYYWLLGVIWV